MSASNSREFAVEAYKLMQSLSVEAVNLVLEMFSWAEFGTWADGAFFKEAGTALIGEALSCNVINQAGEVIGTVSEETTAAGLAFIAAMNPPAKDDERFTLSSARVPLADREVLLKIHELVAEDLKLRGSEAAVEYGLLGTNRSRAVQEWNAFLVKNETVT